MKKHGRNLVFMKTSPDKPVRLTPFIELINTERRHVGCCRSVHGITTTPIVMGERVCILRIVNLIAYATQLKFAKQNFCVKTFCYYGSGFQLISKSRLPTDFSPLSNGGRAIIVCI